MQLSHARSVLLKILAEYTSSFGCDPLDRHRVLATAMGATTLFHYGVNDLLLAESDTGGATVREYVWDDEG